MVKQGRSSGLTLAEWGTQSTNKPDINSGNRGYLYLHYSKMRQPTSENPAMWLVVLSRYRQRPEGARFGLLNAPSDERTSILVWPMWLICDWLART